MDSSKDIISVLKVPILDEGSYALWKMKMGMMIRAIGDEAWEAVEEGWSAPTIEDKDGKVVLKPRSQWTIREKEASKYNSKALYAICNAITDSQFQTIQCCTSAKEAWDKLESEFEGTSNVKTMRLDMLASQFEVLQMDEKETIEDFSTKIRGIAMEAQVLGKKYKDKKLVKKLLRCLPARFESKKTAMSTALDTNNMTFDVAVGHLRTYELEIKSSVGTNQTTFISEQQKKIEKMEEDMALMAKNFKRWGRKDSCDQKGVGSGCSKNNWNDKEKGSKREEARCFECQGVGHVKAMCATAKKKELKCGVCTGFGHTSIECSNKSGNQKSYIGCEESDTESSDDDLTTGFVAFPAIIDDSDSDSESDSEVVQSKDLCVNEGMTKLYNDWVSLGKEKLEWLKEKIEMEEQNELIRTKLKEELEKTKNYDVLMEEFKREQEKARSLEVKLAETMKRVQMLNSGTKELDKILTVGRTSKAAYGLGYDGRSSGDNREFINTNDGYSSRNTRASVRTVQNRAYNDTRPIKVCYYCGKTGHIRRNCYNFQRKVQYWINNGQGFFNKHRYHQVWISKDNLYGKKTKTVVRASNVRSDQNSNVAFMAMNQQRFYPNYRDVSYVYMRNEDRYKKEDEAIKSDIFELKKNEPKLQQDNNKKYNKWYLSQAESEFLNELCQTRRGREVLDEGGSLISN